MTHPNHSRWMHTALVALCFATIVAVWFPGVRTSILELAREIGTRSRESQQKVEAEFAKVQAQIASFTPVTVSTTAVQKSAIPDQISSLIASQVKNSLDLRNAPMGSSESRANCTQQGGFHQDRTRGASFQYAVCVFSDGSECEEELFFREKCHKGQYAVAEDGIPKKPDFAFVKDEDRIIVVNRGWAKSPVAIALFRGEILNIAALAVGTSLDITSLIVGRPSAEHPLTIDPENLIQEIHEDNNTLSDS